ncbi:hypothetical protein ABS755_14870 [Castellaniella sp. FW104-16D08]|uniref:hypothetical protein n=1 Tax=unclassified Castellaniella TaxID=2617606 RepID=UPI003315A6C1
MEQKDFAEALSECLDDEACKQVQGDEARTAQAPETPLNNFFGDDLFTLLYLREGPCSRGLARIRENLEVVSNQKMPRHVRADAALVLGHFVLSRHSKVDVYARGVSHPIDWFRLARQLGSVIGGLAYANALLAEAEQSVQFSLEDDPLPRLVWDSKLEAAQAPSPDARVCQAWYMGARVALRHVQGGFTGWGPEAFGCALACVVNYLTLLPQQQRLTRLSPLPQRRAALAWLKPLWNRLIVAAPEHALDPQAYRMALVEQQLAVFMRLDDLEQGRGDHVRAPVAVGSLVSEGGQIIVIHGEIPETSDCSEKDYLKRYEVLRRPRCLSTKMSGKSCGTSYGFR